MSDHPLFPLLSPSHSHWCFSFSYIILLPLSHFPSFSWGGSDRCNPMSLVRVIYKRMDERLFTRTQKNFSVTTSLQKISHCSPPSNHYVPINSWVGGGRMSPSPYRTELFNVYYGECCTMGGCMSCGGQRPTLWTQLSSSNFPWIPGTKSGCYTFIQML